MKGGTSPSDALNRRAKKNKGNNAPNPVEGLEVRLAMLGRNH